jgi:ribosomal protein S3
MEMTVFVFDGAKHLQELRLQRMGKSAKVETDDEQSGRINPVLDPKQQAGLQSLISRMYNKPVEFKMIRLSKPHLDADILAAFVAQLLTDRRNTPRRVIRDATWKAPLPNALAITAITQTKLQKQPRTFSPADFTIGAASRTSAQGIVEELGLSQVSSVQVEAAGRLTKRLTANRSQRKMARAGANAKGPGYMLRGFRKAHVQYAFRGGKRRVGQFGIRVRLGHT